MASFGETLRQQRELREISLRQVSEATKINIRYLEALEQNHFDVLPGGLFNKGFIRAYAKYVGLDGEAMVTSYLHEIAARNPGTAPDSGAPAPLHRPVDLPQRRAGPRPFAADPAPVRPAITLAPGPAPPGATHAAGASGTGASGAGASRAGASGTAAGDAALGGASPAAVPSSRTAAPAPGPAPQNGPAANAHRAPAAAPREPEPLPHRPTHYEANRPPAVSAIAEADETERRSPSPRALLWILAAVVGAGVVLLVLSLMSGPRRAYPPASTPPVTEEPPMQEDPESAGIPESVSADGAVPDGAAGPAAPQTAPAPGGDPAAPRATGAVTGDRNAAASSGGASMQGAAMGGAPSGGAPAGTPQSGAAPSAGPRPAEPLSIASPIGGPARETPERRPEPGARMELQIEATADAWVNVVCDGRVVVDRMMRDGDAADFVCRSIIRVSATDAGALRLSVNDVPCLPLGDAGTRAYGYTIRTDDVHLICRPSGAVVHERP
jgi:hypothetical protein